MGVKPSSSNRGWRQKREKMFGRGGKRKNFERAFTQRGRAVKHGMDTGGRKNIEREKEGRSRQRRRRGKGVVILLFWGV